MQVNALYKFIVRLYSSWPCTCWPNPHPTLFSIPFSNEATWNFSLGGLPKETHNGVSTIKSREIKQEISAMARSKSNYFNECGGYWDEAGVMITMDVVATKMMLEI